jgi:hypothetical protein
VSPAVGHDLACSGLKSQMGSKFLPLYSFFYYGYAHMILAMSVYERGFPCAAFAMDALQGGADRAPMRLYATTW